MRRTPTIVCDVADWAQPELATVAALARLALELRRRGLELRLRGVPRELGELIELAGLGALLLGSAGERD
jgi:ABC-type transporter Mla MlaB component